MVDNDGKPLKLFAFGNLAHGVFAFGNVARGIVAVGGGISFGVFAFGTNAVGSVLAVGVNSVAPISIALANGAGVFAFAFANAVGGFGGSKVNGAFSPWASLVLGIGLLVASRLMPKAPPLPLAREAAPLGEFLAGGGEAAWVRAFARRSGAGKTTLLLMLDEARAEVEASEALMTVTGGSKVEVFAHLVRTTRLVATTDDYRAPPHEEATIRCDAIEPVARPLRISSVYRLSLIASAIGALAAGAVGIATGG